MKQHILKIIFKIFAHYTKKYLSATKPIVIGITGSVGKTSCRMVITDVLRQRLPNKKIYTSPKNFNSEIGLVLSVFQIEEYTPGIKNLLSLISQVRKKSQQAAKKYDILVLEYGIDHPWDMSFLTSIVRPDYSIFTRLDSVHRAYFSSGDAIWDEKFVLMKNTNLVTYLNASDNYARSHFSDITVPVSWYNGQWIQPKNYNLSLKWEGIVAQFDYLKTNITTNLIWQENTYYIALWIDISEKIGATVIEDSFHLGCDLQPWRCNILPWVGSSIIIDSSYNAAPASMKKMIGTTKNIKQKIYPDHKLACVLWDMRELWDVSAQSHEDIGHELEEFDLVYTVWPEMKQYLWVQNAESFLSSCEAGKHLAKKIWKQNDAYIILVKWSQNTIFTEEAIKELLADKKDVSKLVRQSDDWIKRKEVFFKSID